MKAPQLPSFDGLNVLVVGDVMTDCYMNGGVSRISPEAPVPVVRLSGAESRLGGAGNVALNLKALGATPLLCSMVGDDEYGRSLLESLPVIGIAPDHMVVSPFRRTTVKTRILAQNQQLIRLDQEDDHELNRKEELDFLEMAKNALEGADVRLVLFQDYNKGLLTLRVIREIMHEASMRGIPTAADPKFNNFFAYGKVTLFKPNLKEIRDKVPFEVLPSDLATLDRAAAYINRQLSNTYTMITLSDRGIYLHTPDESMIIPARPRPIADVCGAGDTVISVAGLALAAGMDIQEAAQLANMAGGQVCERVGVVPVDKAALLNEYAAHFQAL
jgi:rfaE bifunctional protein kinase chain/domain